VYNFPKGVYFRTLKYKLLIFSKSKRLLSETANKLRGLRPPDPYKGKGLKFAKEVLVFKPGKQRQK
jgi:large subunit ribosomal protein L6